MRLELFIHMEICNSIIYLACLRLVSKITSEMFSSIQHSLDCLKRTCDYNIGQQKDAGFPL